MVVLHKIVFDWLRDLTLDLMLLLCLIHRVCSSSSTHSIIVHSSLLVVRTLSDILIIHEMRLINISFILMNTSHHIWIVLV